MENREEAKQLVDKYVKSFGDNEVPVDEMYYNETGKHGIMMRNFLEDLAEDVLDQQNKQLLDEIELVNTMNVKLNNNNIKLLNEIDMLKELNATLQFHNIKYQSKIDQLQFELKAADSVNEQKDKEIKNLLLNLTNQNKQ